jgi:hypothetical protein
MTTDATPTRFLPPLPQDGPVNPADYPEGIEWVEHEHDQRTGKLVAVTRLLSAEEWNASHAMDDKEREALQALRRAEAEREAAEAARPFRFVDLDDVAMFAKRDRPCALVDRITTGRGRTLEELLDLFAKDAAPPPRVKAELRMTTRLLVAELKAQRQTNLALRQRVADLEAQLKAARRESAESVQRGPGPVG